MCEFNPTAFNPFGAHDGESKTKPNFRTFSVRHVQSKQSKSDVIILKLMSQHQEKTCEAEFGFFHYQPPSVINKKLLQID